MSEISRKAPKPAARPKSAVIPATGASQIAANRQPIVIIAAAAIANGVHYPDLFAAAFGTPDISAARIAMATSDWSQALADDYLVMERGEFIARGPGSEMEEKGIRQLVAI